MNDLIIKICGMREQADLDCAAALGVNLCGFIFAPQSPRAVTPEQAAALDSGDMLRVGVFVTDDMRFIEETARAARLDRIQLHGDQSMTCANRLSRTLGAERLIRVLWPERYPDLAALEADLAACQAAQERCGSDYVKLQELQAQQAELEAALEAKTERWIYLNELKERIDAQNG